MDEMSIKEQILASWTWQLKNCEQEYTTHNERSKSGEWGDMRPL